MNEKLRPCPFCGSDTAPTVGEIAHGIKTKKYCWSFEREEGYCRYCEDTIEGCMDEARQIDPGATEVFIAELKPYEVNIDGEHIVELLANDAYSEHGELMDGWLDNLASGQYVSLETKLIRAINEWLVEIGRCPMFGTLISPERYDLKTTKNK